MSCNIFRRLVTPMSFVSLPARSERVRPWRAFEIVRLYFRAGMPASEVALAVRTTEAAIKRDVWLLKKIFSPLICSGCE
jgi:hypothetical protein